MALDDLPTTMVAKYGNFTFGPTTETTAVSITPALDAGGRTPKYQVYSITLRTHVAGAATDDTVKAAIAELTKPGQKFTYTGRGIGNIRINIGGFLDCNWGPHARIGSIRPVGAGRAVEITWTVDLAVPSCADGVTRGICEFVFRLVFDVRPNGDTVRRYSGHLRICNNRIPVGGRLMFDTPDAYREEIYPPLVPGFRRTPGPFEVDESKTVLRFSVTDEQMPPNMPPPGVTECRADHSYQSQGLAKWTGTLNGEYELLRGQGVGAAVVVFLGTLRDRVNTAKTILNNEGLFDRAGAPLRAGKPIAVVPLAFTLSEPTIYGPGNQRVRMSCQYFAAGCGLDAILAKGGLWRPVPNTNWLLWSASIATALSARGTAGLRFLSNEDSLVDTCGVAEPRTPEVAPPPREVTPPPGDLAPADARRVAAAWAAAFPPPDPAVSWVAYRNAVRVEEDHGTVVSTALPDEPLAANARPPVWDAARAGMPQTPSLGGVMLGAADDYRLGGQGQGRRGRASVAQRRAEPEAYVYLEGTAVRVGYPIPCPSLADAAGKPLVNCNRLDRGEGFVQGEVGYAGVPVYKATWRLRYLASEALLNAELIPPPTSGLA